MDEDQVTVEPVAKEEPLPRMTETGDGLEIHLDEPKPERKERKQERDPGPDTAVVAARAAIEAARNITADHASSKKEDPFEAREKAIYEQERALGLEFEVLRTTKALTTEKATEYDQKARSLRQELSNIAAQRALASALPQLQENQRQQHYRTLYSDVHDNANALRYAKGRYDMLLAQGEKDGDRLVERAMNDARVAFRLSGGNSGSISQTEKSKFMGAPNQSGGRQAEPNTTVKLGKAEKSMALAMYGDRFNGDEKKAYAAWAKGPGKRAAQAQKAGNR